MPRERFGCQVSSLRGKELGPRLPRQEVDPRQVDRDLGPVGIEDPLGQEPAQHRQLLPQRSAGLLLGPVSPQERGKFRPRHMSAPALHHHREDRLPAQGEPTAAP